MPRREEGSILVLVIGYTAIAVVLIVVAVDTSKVFLARRALAAAADAAALAAAQGVDRAAIYAGPGLRCGQPLPLAAEPAADRAERSVSDDRADLRHWFAVLADPRTSLAGATVGVELSGEVTVPFAGVLGWLDPAYRDGRVEVSETSFARSPVAGGDC